VIERRDEDGSQLPRDTGTMGVVQLDTSWPRLRLQATDSCTVGIKLSKQLNTKHSWVDILKMLMGGNNI
jgi:hypothetical protein